MTTKDKPASGGNRGTGYGDARDSQNDTPFASRLKALLMPIAAHDAALIALLFLILWGALR